MGVSFAGEKMPEELRFFCRHLVQLVWYEGILDPKGNHTQKPTFRCASAFLVEAAGTDWLITAGHVFTGFDQRVQDTGIGYTKPSLLDIWSPEAKVLEPIPFDFFDATPREFVLDDSELGIDIAAIPLDGLVTQMLAQTITQFPKQHWVEGIQHAAEFEAHLLLGTPSAWSEELTEKGDKGGSTTVVSKPTIVLLDRIPIQEAIDMGAAATKIERFAGRIRPKFTITDIQGMSGGPILGFRKEGDNLRYYPLAIQSRWIAKRRIVLGTPLEHALWAFEKFLEIAGI